MQIFLLLLPLPVIQCQFDCDAITIGRTFLWCFCAKFFLSYLNLCRTRGKSSLIAFERTLSDSDLCLFKINFYNELNIKIFDFRPSNSSIHVPCRLITDRTEVITLLSLGHSVFKVFIYLRENCLFKSSFSSLIYFLVCRKQLRAQQSSFRG